MYKPYVYRLTFLHEGKTKHYIGSRYRQYKEIANPSDLLKTYFTSSRYARDAIKEVGVENVKKKILMTFDNADDCIAFETKLLERVDAMNNEMFLNKSNGTFKFFPKKLSEETKERMSIAKKGKKFTEEHKSNLRRNHKGMTGRKFSADHLKKLSEVNSGSNNPFFNSTHTEESKRKISDASKKMWSKLPLITCPHCDVTSKNRGSLNRWHFGNCKKKLSK